MGRLTLSVRFISIERNMEVLISVSDSITEDEVIEVSKDLGAQTLTILA